MQNCEGFFLFLITLPRLSFVVIVRLGVFRLVVFLCGFVYLVGSLVYLHKCSSLAPVRSVRASQRPLVVTS